MSNEKCFAYTFTKLKVTLTKNAWPFFTCRLWVFALGTKYAEIKQEMICCHQNTFKKFISLGSFIFFLLWNQGEGYFQQVKIYFCISVWKKKKKRKYFLVQHLQMFSMLPYQKVYQQNNISLSFNLTFQNAHQNLTKNILLIKDFVHFG